MVRGWGVVGAGAGPRLGCQRQQQGAMQTVPPCGAGATCNCACARHHCSGAPVLRGCLLALQRRRGHYKRATHSEMKE